MKIWEVHRVKANKEGQFDVTFSSQEQKTNISESEADNFIELMKRDTVGFHYVKICNPMGSMMSKSDKQDLIANSLIKEVTY